MTIVWIGVLVFAAGAVGGILNAFLAQQGLVAPRTMSLSDGRKVWDPGWLGNAAVGGFAAVVLWGLYGPLSRAQLVSDGTKLAIPPSLDVAGIVGALVTGIGGARILTNEVDKIVLKSAKKDLGNALADATSAPDKRRRPQRKEDRHGNGRNDPER